MTKQRLLEQKPLLASLTILMAMVSFDAPTWVILFSWFLVILKIFSELRPIPALSRRVTTGLALLLLGQIYLEFRTFFGQEPSAILLMGLTALKIMDYDSPRDHKYLVVLGFMLLAMKPLFSLDLYWVPFLLIAFVGLWWAMLNPHQKQPLNFLVRLFAVSIPVALILFIVFPRVVFPWASRPNTNRAQFGFSEQLNPGRTAALVETDALVFRVRFDDKSFPTMESLYWRGGILKKSFGLNWQLSNLERASHDSRIIKPDGIDTLKYDVFLEPGNLNYIFALEIPRSVQGEGVFVRGYEAGIYRLGYPQGKTILYSGVSDFSDHDNAKPTIEDLQIPELSPKIYQLIEQFKKDSKRNQPEDLLVALREYYISSGFKYTLTPGSYGRNDLEEFLFERKQGFCEHFAGSYATLARALGIPARVVVGFHGGELNGFGNFWRVSTRDAHAWVEVYLSGVWKRVDPTAFAAPTRISRGAAKYFQSVNESQGLINSVALLYNEIHAWIESMNYSWMKFLIEFDREGQKDFLSIIKNNLGWVILSFVLMLAIISLFVRIISKRTKELNPYQEILHEIFQWGHKFGVSRSPIQSPRSFLTELTKVRPEMKEFSERFLAKYEATFYKNQSEIFDKSFREQWKNLKK